MLIVELYEYKNEIEQGIREVLNGYEYQLKRVDINLHGCSINY